MGRESDREKAHQEHCEELVSVRRQDRREEIT